MSATTGEKITGKICDLTGWTSATVSDLMHYTPHFLLVIHFARIALTEVLFTMKMLPASMMANVTTVRSTVFKTWPLSEILKALGNPSLENVTLVMSALHFAGVLMFLFTRKPAKWAAYWYAVNLLFITYVLGVGNVKIEGFGDAHQSFVVALLQGFQVVLIACAAYVIYHKDYAFCFYLQHLKQVVDESRGVLPPKRTSSSPKKSASPKKEEPAAKTRDASPAPVASKSPMKASASPKKSGKKN